MAIAWSSTSFMPVRMALPHKLLLDRERELLEFAVDLVDPRDDQPLFFACLVQVA